MDTKLPHVNYWINFIKVFVFYFLLIHLMRMDHVRFIQGLNFRECVDLEGYSFFFFLFPIFVRVILINLHSKNCAQPLKDGLFWLLEYMKKHKRMICKMRLVSLERLRICI